VKAANAFDAGALGAIIFNEGQVGRTALFGGTLQSLGSIPVVSAPYGLGSTLAGLLDQGPVTIHLQVTDNTLPSAVPEPATLLLLGTGLGAVAAGRRLKKRA
jgi:PEP-CTERM motif